LTQPSYPCKTQRPRTVLGVKYRYLKFEIGLLEGTMRYIQGLVCATILIMMGCQQSNKENHTEYILYGGMEREDVWNIDGCSMEGGVLYLQSSASTTVAMVTQLLPPLSAEEQLLISVIARSPDATASLEIDLYGLGFDDPLQQLSIPAESLTFSFRPFSAIIPSGSSDRGIWFRIFTESRTSIEVDAVSLRTIHSTNETGAP